MAPRGKGFGSAVRRQCWVYNNAHATSLNHVTYQIAPFVFFIFDFKFLFSFQGSKRLKKRYLSGNGVEERAHTLSSSEFVDQLGIGQLTYMELFNYKEKISSTGMSRQILNKI